MGEEGQPNTHGTTIVFANVVKEDEGTNIQTHA